MESPTLTMMKIYSRFILKTLVRSGLLDDILTEDKSDFVEITSQNLDQILRAGDDEVEQRSTAAKVEPVL